MMLRVAEVHIKKSTIKELLGSLNFISSTTNFQCLFHSRCTNQKKSIKMFKLVCFLTEILFKVNQKCWKVQVQILKKNGINLTKKNYFSSPSLVFWLSSRLMPVILPPQLLLLQLPQATAQAMLSIIQLQWSRRKNRKNKLNPPKINYWNFSIVSQSFMLHHSSMPQLFTKLLLLQSFTQSTQPQSSRRKFSFRIILNY